MLSQQKDYANALKYYDEILTAQPDDYDVKVNKAIALHALKNMMMQLLFIKIYYLQSQTKLYKTT